jgi:AraC-like DNA-binding protein
MTEVARQSGFSDGKQFSQAFRREAGVTPSAFRRNGHEGKKQGANAQVPRRSCRS